MLAERFRAVADRLPLSDLGPADRQELASVLERTGAFEDLPGRWQAALLSAEHPAAAPPAAGGCCAGHRAAADAAAQ